MVSGISWESEEERKGGGSLHLGGADGADRERLSQRWGRLRTKQIIANADGLSVISCYNSPSGPGEERPHVELSVWNLGERSGLKYKV